MISEKIDYYEIKIIDFGFSGIIGEDKMSKQRYGTIGFLGIYN